MQELPRFTKLRDTIITIQDLRNLWIHEVDGGLMRKMYCYFLRRCSLNYIFDPKTKIENHTIYDHLNSRKSLLRALKDPKNFYRLK